MKKIAFLGLGVMGRPIAGHLLKKNSQITIFNRDKKKSIAFKKKFSNYNVKLVNTPVEASKDSEYIFSCVGDDNDLKEIYFSEKGIIKSIKPQSYIIDHTTTSSNIATYCFEKFKEKRCYFLDAPISGGEIGAIKGTLSIMIGGDRKKFLKARELMNVYSKSINYMGKSGNGQITKMVNQICVAGVIQGLAEGLHFAKEKKLNFGSLLNSISSGAAQSWQMDNRANTMWKNKFNFGFMNKWMKKDLLIIINAAKKENISLPCTNKILAFYKQLIKEGYDNLDTSSLIKLLNKQFSD